QITEFAYDELDRLVRISDADGRLTEYRRDLAGRLVQVLDTVTGEVRYEYDLLNRLTREITDRGVIDYQYDATGRLVQRTVNGSEVTDYEYDAVGRIVRIDYSGQNGNTQTLTYTYNATGQLETKTGPNGIIQSHDYDAVGHLTSIIYTSPEGEELERIDYAFDPSGQIVQKTRSGGIAVPETPFVATYGDDNQMLTFDGHPLTYDDNGNLIERETDTGRLVYEYNSDNRLIRYERYEGQETQSAVSATYAYDKDGRRIKKAITDEAGTAETHFTWDGTRLIAERDENGNLLKSYRYGLGFAPTQVIDANGIYDVHVDHLDTPQTLTDQNGNVVWKADYTAYGSAAVDEDPDGDGTNITFNIRFPGQYFDAESGLHYNFHRYYDSMMGRYITRDPIGLVGGLNVYGYVGGNPVTKIDPNGKFGFNVHFAIGYTAALQAGYGFSDAVVIGYYTAAADIGTQGVPDSHRHSMTPGGSSRDAARAATDNFINEQIGTGTLEGLGNALHAAQDYYAHGHGFQDYAGNVTPSHILNDTYPNKTDFDSAYDESLGMIRDFRGGSGSGGDRGNGSNGGNGGNSGNGSSSGSSENCQ
ncbi:MAG TPA: RHS repeat-associated core domain-containing protein, partial [Gammaproteobacteria bacterium]